MESLLAGKVALVLGASRGIGAGSARVLAAHGARVVVAARDQAGLDGVVRAIRTAGGEAFAVATDAREAAQLARLVDATVERYGRLDVAFNNAGEGHMPVPYDPMSVEAIDDSLAINLRGVLLAMKYELAAMVAGGGGAIVNMSSTAGLQGARGLVTYSAAKHAIIGATRSAALEYAARGIRVNAVAPGPVMNDRIAALSDEQRAPILRAVPLGKIGTPEDIGEAVAWLCSARAAFVTGAVLSIDGGRMAGFN